VEKFKQRLRSKKYLEKQNKSVVQFHLSGSRWVNKLVNPPLEVIYQPREILLTADLKRKMEQAILSSPAQENFRSFLETDRGNFTSGIAKVIKTFMGETISSPRKRAWGWEINELLNGELSDLENIN
jgi:hypothetical protein